MWNHQFDDWENFSSQKSKLIPESTEDIIRCFEKREKDWKNIKQKFTKLLALLQDSYNMLICVINVKEIYKTCALVNLS